MDRTSLAREFAAHGLVQELTRLSRVLNATQEFRVWRDEDTAILKMYASETGQSRALGALDALSAWNRGPIVLESGETDRIFWVLFEDAGLWNLQTLPENPELARTAGTILRELHEQDSMQMSKLSRTIDQTWVAVDFQATLRQLERYRGRVGVGQDLITAARGINPPFASTPVVSHTDPVTRNFVVNDAGNVTLISWESAALAPPEWDLSRAAWSLSMHVGPVASNALLESYGKKMDEVLMDRWIVYHAAQMLVQGTERGIMTRPTDVPAGLVEEFNRAVLGATAQT